MPNWCYNTVNVYGPTDEVRRLFDTIKVEGGGWTDLMPMPQVLKGTRSPAPTSTDTTRFKKWLDDGDITEARYDELVKEHETTVLKAEMALLVTGFDNWYDWCHAHWGTKWGDCDTTINEFCQVNEHIASFGSYFETAWGPFSESFWRKVTSDYEVAITIWNTEESDAFFGTQAFYKGELIWDDIDNEAVPVEYDDDNPDAFFSARDEFYEKRCDASEDNALDALCYELQGDDRWTSWISLANRAPSPEHTTL